MPKRNKLTATYGMADIKTYYKAGEIRIGTLFYVTPVAPLNKLYKHVIIVTNIKEDGVELLHLRKGLFIKLAEKVFINFSTTDDTILKFDRGVEFISSETLSENEIKYLHYRMEKVLIPPHIPYGLNSKNAFNCENLALYVKKGVKTTSYQVINFVKKYRIIGYVAVSTFDKVMIITNKIGSFLGYFKNVNKKKK